MPWLNHPKFAHVRDEILEDVRKNEYRFRRTPNVLLLCGAVNSKPRDRLAEYIRKRREDTLIFYAEDVGWRFRNLRSSVRWKWKQNLLRYLIS